MKPFTNGFHQAGVPVFNIVLSLGGNITPLPNEGLPLAGGQTDLL